MLDVLRLDWGRIRISLLGHSGLGLNGLVKLLLGKCRLLLWHVRRLLWHVKRLLRHMRWLLRLLTGLPEGRILRCLIGKLKFKEIEIFE